MADMAPIEHTRLSALLSQLGTPRILVVGDVFLDGFTDGVVERLSPDSAAPVMRITAERWVPGGAANTAVNAASLGGAVEIVSVIGDDESGHRLRILLGEAGVGTSSMLAGPAVRTITKTRFVGPGRHHLLRVDDETIAPVSRDLADRLVNEIQTKIARTDVIVLSDYAKGIFLSDLASRVIELAAASGVPVVVDPKGADFSRYRGASFVTPNLAELAAAIGFAHVADTEVVASARRLALEQGLGNVIVTLGAAGAVHVDRTSDHHVAAHRVRDADTTGAGDTFVAGLAVSLGSGLEPADAVVIASAAAGYVCAKAGTASVTRDEIVRGAPPVLEAHAAPTGVGAAADVVRTWRQGGLVVGFTNGCFDVLHAGHVHLLEKARASCDRLVVGLNTDESVRLLKGPTRPIHHLDHRARVLLGLRAVDMVVPFADSTPLALIDALTPDVLIKGSDYTVETVVGADRVMAYGGSVLLIDVVANLGTTATLRKLERKTS